MVQSFTTGRRFQFGMRSMFVVVTAFALWLGWELQFIRQRRAARQDFLHRGGMCDVNAGLFRYWTMPEKTIPFWRRWMGDKVTNNFVVSQDSHLTKEEIKNIERLFPEASVYD
jgi:hypothetical protein